jgi:hypothetical protein
VVKPDQDPCDEFSIIVEHLSPDTVRPVVDWSGRHCLRNLQMETRKALYHVASNSCFFHLAQQFKSTLDLNRENPTEDGRFL